MIARLLWLMIAVVGSMAYGTHGAQASQPVVSDSRIKTFVYNSNDVFDLLTHYGYQSNVEFSEKESVETISIGDRVSWQVVPSGHRLFIRAMEEDAATNMTVVTNMRTYQFDLRSVGGNLKPSQELSYVVRFYYPDEDDKDLFSRPLEAQSAVMAAQPAPSFSFGSPSPTRSTSSINLQYTYTGSDALAPQKMFDNGRATFLRLSAHPQGIQPRLFVVTPDQREIPVQMQPVENGFAMVPTIARKFVVRYGDDEIICIYNEKN